MNYSEKLKAAKEILREGNGIPSLQKLSRYLNDEISHYNWVGFYIMEPHSRLLHLGPYSGKPTDHTIIPYGKGICGQVAMSGETYISQDVAAEENYIACSTDVKSELVEPIYYQGELIAQLDIDSNTPRAFSSDDENFLREICKLIAEYCGEILHYKNYTFITDGKK